MNVHEHQAKALLLAHGVPVPPGRLAGTAKEAAEAATALGGEDWVVKAQIHAGGRAAAGGVVPVKSEASVRSAAERLLGTRLKTDQTGPTGQIVKSIYVEQACRLQKEVYLGVRVDRQTARVTFTAAPDPGTSIARVAARAPTKAINRAIDPAAGFTTADGKAICDFLGLEAAAATAAGALFAKVYETFVALDAQTLEISPLGLTDDGDAVAIDARMSFDDNALFRHPDIAALRDEDEEEPGAREAARHELNYIKLDGDIGCLIGGAGLAMATMDLLADKGGAAANFADIRPGATRQHIAGGMKLLLTDPGVKAVLVNVIGGGIMRCDLVAEGIVWAARDLAQERGQAASNLDLPVIVRFDGTNTDVARKTLDNSAVRVIWADSMAEAASRAVDAARTASPTMPAPAARPASGLLEKAKSLLGRTG